MPTSDAGPRELIGTRPTGPKRGRKMLMEVQKPHASAGLAEILFQDGADFTGGGTVTVGIL
jgi:hypothetical protein